MKIPTQIKWVPVYKVPTHCYREVLVLMHKHSAQDWDITFGCILPVNDYKECQIRTIGDKEIPKHTIIGIGLYETYGKVIDFDDLEAQ